MLSRILPTLVFATFANAGAASEVEKLEGITWEEASGDNARMTVTHGGGF